MSYVGATAERLEHVAARLTRVAEDAGAGRARIAAMLQEAGESTSTVATLARVEQWAVRSAADATQAAVLAAADASACPPSAPVQTGLRASMGLVDDVLLDVFFVNDLSRVVLRRDMNTGTAVGPGGRALSAAALIPFGKLAKLAKIGGLADAGAQVTAAGARRMDEPAEALHPVRGVIDETFNAQGEVTSRHVLDPDGALDAGMSFLGDGYRELGRAGSGVFRSEDGLRQFRIDESSLLGGHRPWVPHVHLESFARPGGPKISNNHVPLKELE